MKYQPINDQILIELDPLESEFGNTGIIRPECAKEKPMWGTVKACGPGAYRKRGPHHVFISTTLSIGDRALVPWSTGNDLVIGGRLHVQCREDQILATEDIN